MYIAFDDLQSNPGSYIYWKLIFVNEHFCYKLLILLRESLLMFVMTFNSYDTNSVCAVIVTNVILDSFYLFYSVHLPTIFLVKFNSTKELVHFC